MTLTYSYPSHVSNEINKNVNKNVKKKKQTKHESEQKNKTKRPTHTSHTTQKPKLIILPQNPKMKENKYFPVPLHPIPPKNPNP